MEVNFRYLTRHYTQIASSAISIVIALGVGGVIIAMTGHDPWLSIYTIFSGALGSSASIGQTANLTAILLLTGLATMVSFSSGIFNVGMEGQLYLGALGTVAVVVVAAPLGPLAPILGTLVGMVIGAGYALIPASLKAKIGVNEVVTTLLMNYVALFLVDYVAAGALHQPGAPLDITVAIPTDFRLPGIPGTEMNVSIMVAILATVAVAILFLRTKLGFELRMMSGNILAAKYAGVRIERNTMLSMAVSGALAGLAGAMLVLGITFAWFAGASKYYGYVGIGVALLGQLNPFAVILSALFFSILNEGGIAMQTVTGVPYAVAQAISALIIIVTLIRIYFERVRHRGGI